LYYYNSISNKMADYEDRYNSEDDYDYDEETKYKLKDEYLCDVVKELLENCENVKKDFSKNEYGYPYEYCREPKLIDWTVEDISYDIEKCSSYCIRIYNSYDGCWEKSMCSSCKKIINDRLRVSTFIHKILYLEKQNKDMQNAIIELQKNINAMKNGK
jgi:hypothetical protein